MYQWILGAVIWVGAVPLLWAQGRLEVNMQVGGSSTLEFPQPFLPGENYSLEGADGLAGEAHLRYSHPISPAVLGMGGIGYGIQSTPFSFRAGDSFTGLSADVMDEVSVMPLHHVYGVVGVRLELVPTTPQKLGFQAGLRTVYPLRASGQLEYTSFQADRAVQILEMELIQNEENRVFLAPELGVYFRWQAQDRPIGWMAGVLVSWSRRPIVNGMYTFYGEDLDTSGPVELEYRQLGAWFSGYVLLE